MIRNVGLTSALNLYRAGIQFGLNVALAHFLTPGDFGQVALVLPISLFILLIGDFGITGAIVSSSATARQAGAASAICQGFGVAMPLLAGALYLVGGLEFMPQGTAALLLGFSLVTTLSMVAVVPRAMMERGLRYGKLATIETAASTVAFVASVGAAAAGAGMWSFLLYHLTMQTLRCAAFWFLTRRDIERNLDLSLAVPLMRFGGWVVAFNLVNYLMRNLDRYIVGGWMGTETLGFYSLSYQVMLIPLMIFTWPATGVLLSTLSRLKGQPKMRREAFLAVLMLVSCATVPMMAFVALRADLIFGTILPPRWAPVGPITQMLAIAGALQSITAFVGALFMISGQVQRQFWFGVAITIMTLATQLIAVASTRSLVVMVDAYVVLTLLVSVAYLAMMARLLGLAFARLLAALIPAATITLVAWAAMLLADALSPVQVPPICRLLVNSVAFCIGWGALIWLQRRTALAALSTLRLTGSTALTA
ncbi:oligosaccharide flippase family protein [Sphingomonas sp. IC4-52]|uniref:oligosaccharide flippase family protein n=1 Tax=Sphingomonas sp. IC4-52 TaxID=2887202 RepID=UPI001D12F24C|nr:oligosaccharide flippase family protein [Sphingomonas sp. IC4-52]MCC2980805.1 oligosaccharide flippase family protein [Sphingomonas sp. IC4-52]